MKPPETWREVAGCDGYDVSNYGRVRSWKARGRWGIRLAEPKIMSPKPDRDGYLLVHIRANGRSLTPKVHRLVLESFVGGCPDGMECAHLNGLPSDNRLENLEWSTPKENSGHKVTHGTMSQGERHGLTTITDHDVRQIRIARGDTCSAVAFRYGISPTTVSRIHRRKSWGHVQ